MKYPIKFLLLIVLSTIFLAACTTLQPIASEVSVPVNPTSIPPSVPTATAPLPTVIPATPYYPPEPVQSDLSRTDEQGVVVVIVTPLNLDQSGETLDFDVALDTHSVDLSMDLAQMAELSTDKGVVVKPIKWDAPMGGHHVAGILSFPGITDGVSILDGASTLTIKMIKVAAPERIFTWNLTGG
ncbi:MAG TPA: hypothetical protein VN364_04565 [Bellilinea sp.]|nr:hypothetical protein [Bellilinea sp.]